VSESPPTVALTLSGGYYFNQINRLIGDLQPLFELDRTGTRAIVVVDLSTMTFIGPCALALLVAILHRLRHRHLTAKGGSIVPPRAPGIATYLHRIDFYKRLFDEAAWPDFVDKTEVAGMRECKHFPSDPDVPDWGDELRRVTHDIINAIEELIQTDDAAHTSLEFALGELTDNVGYHADTKLGGFAAVQWLRSQREIEIGIVDLGVGITESLRRNPSLEPLATDDLASIHEALRATVTSTPERNSGYGLTYAQFLLALNGGRLLVRSGRGHVVRGAKTSDRLVPENLPGTLVGLRLQTGHPLDFEEAYRLLDEAIATAQRHAHDD
jgi:anti-sigma regulatory factor (Ser/Thr protein kinase)